MALDGAFVHLGDRRNLGDRKFFKMEECDECARYGRQRIHAFAQSLRDLLITGVRLEIEGMIRESVQNAFGFFIEVSNRRRTSPLEVSQGD